MGKFKTHGNKGRVKIKYADEIKRDDAKLIESDRPLSKNKNNAN